MMWNFLIYSLQGGFKEDDQRGTNNLLLVFLRLVWVKINALLSIMRMFLNSSQKMIYLKI